MSGAARSRPVVSATISTAVALAILGALGVWQLQRRAWKHEILADIERAERFPAVPLGATPPRFSKVEVSGIWRAGTALYGSDVRDAPDGRALLGAQRLQVLLRPRAPPVLVDQGWVPTEGAAPPEASGPARLEAFVRAPERPGWLSAEDSPATHRFFTLDPARIGAALGAPGVAPFTLVALGPPIPGAPVPAEHLPRPPDNHLQYAFTWFGLAAALVGVYGAWVLKR